MQLLAECEWKSKRRLLVSVRFLISIIFLHAAGANAFAIFGGLGAGGTVHQDITREALRKISIQSQLGRSTFTASAIEVIVEANRQVDDVQVMPSLHCDDNNLNACSLRIGDLKKIIISRLSDPNPAGMTEEEQWVRADYTRQYIGSALHTLQDFYSHTNWVENNPTTVATFLGNSPLPRFDGNSVEKNCAPDTSTLVTRKPFHLISGYAIGTGVVDLQIAIVPDFECAHGLVQNGIHKDWPERIGGATAKKLAVVATVEFVQQIIAQASNPQSVCAFLGGDLECLEPKDWIDEMPSVAVVAEAVRQNPYNGPAPGYGPAADLVGTFNLLRFIMKYQSAEEAPMSAVRIAKMRSIEYAYMQAELAISQGVAGGKGPWATRKCEDWEKFSPVACRMYYFNSWAENSYISWSHRIIILPFLFPCERAKRYIKVGGLIGPMPFNFIYKPSETLSLPADALTAPTGSPTLLAGCASYGGDANGNGICDNWERSFAAGGAGKCSSFTVTK